MSILADSSTIFRALASRKTMRVAGENSLDLARYEVGNAILKELVIFKVLSPEQAEVLAHEGETLFSNMTMFSALSEEEVLAVAFETGMSFYDASYLLTAKNWGLTLATEDTRLSRVAQRLGISTVSLDKIT